MNRLLRALLGAGLLGMAPFAANALVYVAHGGGNVGAPHGGEIGIIDQSTYAYTPIGSYGSLSGLASDGTVLYAYQTNTKLLLKIDPMTGAVLFSAPSGTDFTDLAYDPTGGFFYGTGTDFGLYRVDVTSGVTTLISATTPGSGGFRQIAFSPAGTLYLHATNTPGQFFTVDPTNGAVISTINGGVPGGALGLEFDPSTGLLIASECCGTPDSSLGERLWSIDPSTGAATLLFDYDDGRRMQDFAFLGPVPVPEPASLALLALGLAGLAATRRRKK